MPLMPEDHEMAKNNMNGEPFLETAVANQIDHLNENKYKALFEATPVSLWEEDFSDVKKYIDALRAKGVTDFQAHFEAHPEEVFRCVRLIKVTDVNQATLNLYKAQSKQHLLDNMGSIFGEDSFELFKEELTLMANGVTIFQAEGINYTLEGKQLNVIIRWSVVPGFEESFSQVIVSIFDVTDQRVGEAQVKLQATALEAVENAVAITSRRGEILWVNPAFTTLTGYSPEEVIGQNPTILKSGKNDKSFYKNLWQTILSGQVWECEEIINQRKDGTFYYEHMIITPMKDADGQVYRFIAVKEDITERKNMELQLRRQLQEEELLRRITSIPASVNNLADTIDKICQEIAAFSKAPIVSFSFIDPKSNWVNMMGSYIDPDLETAGYLAAPLPSIVPPDLLECQRDFWGIPNIHTAARFESVRADLEPYSNHSALLVPVKSSNDLQGLFVLETIGPVDFNPRNKELINQVVAYLEQMLQRVQAEQLVQKERDTAQQVMNNLGQGLVLLEPNWAIDFCNLAFANLLGYKTAQLMGRPFAELIDSKNDPDSTTSWITAEEQHANSSVGEMNLLRSDGKPISVMITAVPRVNDFEIGGAICVVTDLTAQKKIASSLADARDQAVEASRLKSDFLANMSHEIRTPLNAVIGMTGLLLDTHLTTDQLDFAKTIQGSSELLLGLLNDILDFSKIEAGKMVLEERPFSIRKCIEESMDVVASKADESGLELTYAIASDVPDIVLGDITRVRQVLVNLLNNAVKFTESGEVVLKVKLTQLQKPSPDEIHENLLIQFAVRDTGIGISPEKQKRLFQSFSQVDASTTRKYGGSGLGLAISRQLVEMMGGEIWVESKPEQGSTFNFTLATTMANMAQQPPQPTLPSQLVGKRLLIVDDNETNRKILVKQTSLWGLHAYAVPSGAKALKLLAEGQNFELAILDMQMPKMDGITLAKEIRKLRDKQTLPMVMLSSIGDRAEHIGNEHFSAFLTKPVKQKLLLESLLNVLGETAESAKVPSKKNLIDLEMSQKHPLRILLAEDNLINQKVATRLLQRMGYAADIANNGLEAIKKLQQQSYDVILMDVQMPKLDGVSATQRIRKQWPESEQPRIIAMTANALSGDREKYLAEGMDDYISKPVHIQELMTALAEATPLPAKSK